MTQKKTVERLWITSGSPMWRFLRTTTRILTSLQREQSDLDVPTSKEETKEETTIILSLFGRKILNSLFEITSTRWESYTH